MKDYLNTIVGSLHLRFESAVTSSTFPPCPKLADITPSHKLKLLILTCQESNQFTKVMWEFNYLQVLFICYLNSSVVLGMVILRNIVL